MRENLPVVDGDLIYLPEPVDGNDVLTSVYFYSKSVRHTTVAELGDDGLFLHWDGMRFPFQLNWSIRPVFAEEVTDRMN